MMTFRSILASLKLPLSTARLLSEIAEAKGRQELFIRQSPAILKALRDRALLESVESSNRLEGVTVQPARLRLLVLGTARSKDRSEEQIQRYRSMLQRIHTDSASLPITPDTLQQLHQSIQEGASDAGQWKAAEHATIGFRAGAAPRERFRPVSVADTPTAMEELCGLYRQTVDRQPIPALIAHAALILDFLCIQPFQDSNSRVSRLLTALALHHHGFAVGQFVSLDRLIEESREDYHFALRSSSTKWHEGKHDLLPWLDYFLALVRRAYVQVEEQTSQPKKPREPKTPETKAPDVKGDVVLVAIRAAPNPFRIADLEHTCPGVSVDSIRSVLKELRAQGKVECLGRGQHAKWQRLSEQLSEQLTSA